MEAITTIIRMYKYNPLDGIPDGSTEDTQIKKIGNELDKLGGIGMMLYVHQTFSRYCPNFSRSLEMKWDGIGEWRG